MPDQPGVWKYAARFSSGVDGPTGAFECSPAAIPGMITTDETNPRWFGYRGGKHELIRALHVGDRFFASRDNSDTGEPWNARRRRTFLDWAQEQGYNTLSIAGHLLNRDEENRGRGWNSPDLWDGDRPNPEEFDRMEEILDDLRERGIIVYPFAGFFGRSSNFPRNPQQQEVYLKYCIARLAPYWNLLFMVGGPEPRYHRAPFLQVEEIHRLGRRIAELDPFGHPLSVHNPTGDDPFKDADWHTYGILQGPKTLDRAELGDGLLKNHHPEKPLLAQETLWSGNSVHIRRTKGGYSDTDLRKNAYVIMMSAAALVFADNDGKSSSGFSGSMDLRDAKLHRHEIIRQVWEVFETIPFYEMQPHPELITTCEGANAFCLADPGRQYLFYLDAPGSLSATLEGGPYEGEWVNAQDRSDRREVRDVATIEELSPPDGGDDWLLHLRSAHQ